MGEELRDLRCHDCGRLMFREAVVQGRVQIKCHDCNALTDLRFVAGERRVVERRLGTRRDRRRPSPV